MAIRLRRQQIGALLGGAIARAGGVVATYVLAALSMALLSFAIARVVTRDHLTEGEADAGRSGAT